MAPQAVSLLQPSLQKIVDTVFSVHVNSKDAGSVFNVEGPKDAGSVFNVEGAASIFNITWGAVRLSAHGSTAHG